MLSVEMISRQNRCHYVYKGGNMMRRILHIVLITALMFLNVMYTFEAHVGECTHTMFQITG